MENSCTEKIEQKTSRNYETKLKVVWTLDLDHHDARLVVVRFYTYSYNHGIYYHYRHGVRTPLSIRSEVYSRGGSRISS